LHHLMKDSVLVLFSSQQFFPVFHHKINLFCPIIFVIAFFV
jgi:hypothetical protein